MSIKTFLNKPYSKTYPKKRWLITILVFSWLILGGLFGALLQNNVDATSITYGKEDMELYSLGSQIDNATTSPSWIYTRCMQIGKSQIQAGTVVSGTRAYQFNADANTFLNFSKATSQYIDNFTTYFQFFGGGLTSEYLYFKNSLTNATVFSLKTTIVGGGGINFYASDGTTVFWSQSSTSGTWNTFSLVKINTYTARIYLHGGGGSGTGYADFPLTQDYNNISGMYKYSDPTNGYILFMDDVYLTLSDSTSSGGLTCGYDMSSYSTIGTLANNYGTASNSKSIFENYVAPITTSIKGVELAVDVGQYNIDSNLNNYHLSINNLPSTIPNCFYQKDAGTYILFWSENIGIVNQTVSFNFTHDILLDSTHYWYQYIGGSGQDLDFDGEALSGEGVISHQVCEWIKIGYLPFYVCVDVYTGGYKNYDLSYKFYHTGITTTDIYNYTDLLGLFGYSYKSGNYYYYNLADERPIICSYTLGDPSYSYTLELWEDGVQIFNTDFTKNCVYPSGAVGYSTNITGVYEFKLKKVGYVYNITAIVYGTVPDVSILTQPSITDIGMPYLVIYKFTHPQGYDGVADLFDILENANKHDLSIFSNTIFNNVSGNFTYNSVSKNTEYWRLFINKNGQYFPIGHIANHYIRLPNIVDNTIKCNIYSIEIQVGNPTNKSVIITGSHTFPGADVGVYVGGVFKGYVNSQLFTYFYVPITPGIFTVDLRIVQNGTTIILCSTPQPLTVIVTAIDNTLPLENPLDTLGIPVIFRIPLGIGLAMILLCIPLIVQYKAHVDINIFVYLFFGLFGLIISTVLGLLPVIILGVIILILVLIIIIQWLRNKTG